MADSFQFNRQPPQEVTSYLSEKALVPSFSYKDVWGAQHATGFTVAKATQIDVLTTLDVAMQQALDNGVPYEQFAKELTPRLQELGWWGKKLMTDPKTGEQVLAQLGSPRRLKTIYWANTRTARAAGQWNRAQRSKRFMPYFLYGLGNSERHRPLHAEQEGTILPVDHPHWNYWFAPNGWGCKCWIRQIDRAEAESLGGESEEPSYPMRTYTNDRTGETVNIPVGIDPGWHTNPGKERFGTLRRDLGGTLAGANEPLRRAAVQSSPLAQFAEAALDGSIKGNLSIPFAAIGDDLGTALGTKARAGFLSAATILEHAAGAGMTPAQYSALAQKMLDEGEVWKSAKGALSVIQVIDGLPYLMGLKISAQDELFITTLHRWRERSIRKLKDGGTKLK